MLARRCYAAMTATSRGDSHNATSGSTAWAGSQAEERLAAQGGPWVGVVDWAWQGAKGMPACLLGLFLDRHRQETLPSYSLLGV